MSELSIKVTIADRVYPLTIERSEEEMVRKAADMVNQTVETYRNKFNVKDKTDLLAMTALQFANTSPATDEGLQKDKITKELEYVKRLLNEHLTK